MSRSRFHVPITGHAWRVIGLIAVAAVTLAWCNRASDADILIRNAEAHEEAERGFEIEAEAVRRGLALDEIFDGRCSDDCSGHQAGYLWAFDQPVGADFSCQDADGQSFREGCERGVIARDYAS